MLPVHLSMVTEILLRLSRLNRFYLVNNGHRSVFVGTEAGTISYYKLSDDLNILESIRTLNAHQGAVLQSYFCPLRQHIFSIGSDDCFVWSDVNSGNKLGNYNLPSKPTCLQVRLLYYTILHYKMI
jgi:WD40 repeat protein